MTLLTLMIIYDHLVAKMHEILAINKNLQFSGFLFLPPNHPHMAVMHANSELTTVLTVQKTSINFSKLTCKLY